MRFWDASALVPLVVREATTRQVLSWLRDDPDLALWGLSRLEVASEIERRSREGLLSSSERIAALRRLERIANDAHEIADVFAVRTQGLALLARHALRAADAAQLGAALVLAAPDPSSVTMVVLDRGLADAAEREGLRVLGPGCER